MQINNAKKYGEFVEITAPVERTASEEFPNVLGGDQLNAKDLKNQSEEMQMWQDKMVNAYVERCECDREEIQALMDKDIFISTSEALTTTSPRALRVSIRR